jgi:hypothetical protein
MKQREFNNGKFLSIKADDGKVLYNSINDSWVTEIAIKAEEVDNWAEVDASEKPAYNKAQYDKEVERLIALKYSTGQEIQFAREQDSAGEKYKEYLAYIDECKVTAKQNLIDGTAGGYEMPQVPQSDSVAQ